MKLTLEFRPHELFPGKLIHGPFCADTFEYITAERAPRFRVCTMSKRPNIRIVALLGACKYIRALCNLILGRQSGLLFGRCCFIGNRLNI